VRSLPHPLASLEKLITEGSNRPSTFDFLSKLLASANSFSSLFNERVVASLLRLVAEVIQVDELRDSTFLALDMLRSLSPAVLSSVAEPLMAGLSRVFVNNADRIQFVFSPSSSPLLFPPSSPPVDADASLSHSSATEWNLLFALFSATAQQEAAAKISVDLLRQLAAGQLGATLHHENYAAFLQTLAGFAHVAQDRKTLPDRSTCVTFSFSVREQQLLTRSSRLQG
jgi:brefeldin A-resistance guanine nucleotide exchange factor 1